MKRAILAAVLIAVAAPAWAAEYVDDERVPQECGAQFNWCLTKGKCVETKAIDVRLADPNGEAMYERWVAISFSNGKTMYFDDAKANSFAKALFGKTVKVCYQAEWKDCPTNLTYTLTDTATGKHRGDAFAISHCLMPPPKE